MYDVIPNKLCPYYYMQKLLVCLFHQMRFSRFVPSFFIFSAKYVSRNKISGYNLSKYVSRKKQKNNNEYGESAPALLNARSNFKPNCKKFQNM